MVTTNLTATPSPEAPGAGAVAHMSLHLKPTMSKSHQPRNPDFCSPERQNQADNHRSPIFGVGGLLSVYVGDRLFEPFEAAFPSGEAASKGDL